MKFSRWKKWKEPKVAFRGIWSVRNYLLYHRKRLNWGCLEVLTLLESDVAVVARIDANNPTIDDPEPETEIWQLLGPMLQQSC